MRRMEDVMYEWTNAKLCDVGNLILGVILLASPWLFTFAAGFQTQNALVTGIVIIVLSIAALTAFAVWEEWLNLIVGLWLIASPWVLGFPRASAMLVDVVIGIIVVVLAAIELWYSWQPSSRDVVNR